MILATAALAHVPHDTVRALAAPADLDAATPWLAVADPQDVHLLLRSENGGGRWDMVGGEPLADELRDATQLPDGTDVLLADGVLWWRAGEGWESGATPDDVRLLDRDGPVLLLGGASGVWSGPPGGPYTHEIPTPVVAFGQGAVAVGEDGHVRRRDAGAWEDLGGSFTAAAAGDVVYAGDADGAVWRLDAGEWVACGTIPPGAVPEVVNLAIDRDAVYVATGTHAPWRSDDGCGSWVDVGVGADVVYGLAGGGAGDTGDAWPVLVAADGAVVVAGWAGLFTSEDAGETWVSHAVVPADYTRGLAFGAGFAEDGRVFLGTYGAGPAVTVDGGASFAAPAHGLVDGNVQRVDVADRVGGVVFAVVGHEGFVSRDAGATWTPFGGDVGDLVAWESPDHVWAVGTTGEVTETLDGGATWLPLDGLAEALAGSVPQGTGLYEGRPCVTGSLPPRLVCEDADGAWQTLHVGTSGSATDPFEVDGRLVFGEDAGVRASDDGGASWTLVEVAPGDPVVTMAMAETGRLFLATRSALLMYSDDAGSTWDTLGDRLPARVYVLAPRPGYAVHPDLLVGTHDGTFLARGTVAPTRWAAYQRLDAQGALLSCSGCPESLADADASMDGLQPLEPLDTLSGWVRGARIRVLGESTGVAELRVDGDVEAPIGYSDDVLADVEVAAGWHFVEIVGVEDGVLIDAIEGFGDGALLELDEEPIDTGDPWPDPADTGSPPPGFRDCGCGRGGAALVLLPLSVVWRRKARQR
ncbi:MAG: hypothetical protein ACOZNI_32930 [Myxococcota bacterium]